MLTLAIFTPLLGAIALVAVPRLDERASRLLTAVAAATPLALLSGAWLRFDSGGDALFQQVTDVEWIPTLGVGWRGGVDGIALAPALASAALVCCARPAPGGPAGRRPP